MSYSTASPTAQPSFGKMSEPPTTLKLLVIGQSGPVSPRTIPPSLSEWLTLPERGGGMCGVFDRVTGWGDRVPHLDAWTWTSYNQASIV